MHHSELYYPFFKFLSHLYYFNPRDPFISVITSIRALAARAAAPSTHDRHKKGA